MGPGPPARAGARARARARRPGGGGSGAAALAGTWLTRPGAAGWRENKAAGGRGSWAQQFRGNFFFPLLAAPRPPCGGGGPRGPRGGRRGAAGRGRLPGRPPPRDGGRGRVRRAPPAPPPGRHGRVCAPERGAHPARLLALTHTLTRSHTYTHTHKGKEPYSRSRSPSRRRRRRRGRRAAAIPCAPGPAAAGGASPHFERGCSLRRADKMGEAGGPARGGGRAHVAAPRAAPGLEAGPRPRRPGRPPLAAPKLAGGGPQWREGVQSPPRARPNFHGFKKTLPWWWGGERAVSRSGFCPSSLFTRRNFRPDVFSQN